MVSGLSTSPISHKIHFMKHIWIVGIGGMIGSMLRYLSSIVFSAPNQHWATMCINILGSLLIGIVFGLTKSQTWMNDEWRLFLATGVCGGFTTFSTFSHDNLMLLQDGKYLTLAVYTIASLVLGILAVWVGYKLAG